MEQDQLIEDLDSMSNDESLDVQTDFADGSSSSETRSVGLAKFVFVAFFLTCGGPFGVESAVSSGGILYTMIGFAFYPLLWAVPQVCEFLSSKVVNE